MKNILIAEDVKHMMGPEHGLLSRSDITIYTAVSNDDILRIHSEKRMNLIISPLHAPGMKSELLWSRIRNDRVLKTVSVILVCPDTPADVERCAACKANAVMTLPLDTMLLMENVRQLLDVSGRESYRVLLNVKVEGDVNNRSFFCRSENLSSTGILIETDKDFEKGDRLKCSFFLPDSKQVSASGEIVRIARRPGGEKKSLYGIHFLQMTKDAVSAIESFLEKKSQVSTSRR